MSAGVIGLHLAWGALPRTGDQHESTLSSSEELHHLLDRIHADALALDFPQQVDAWLNSVRFSKSDPPEVPDPLIQIMVAHPQRGSLRWLGAEACFQAIEPDLPPLAEEIIYDNGGAADPMET